MSPSAVITANSSRSQTFYPEFPTRIFPLADNSFPAARFYLNEHRLCSLHWGASAPRFLLAVIGG
jgi:hypothetical protein